MALHRPLVRVASARRGFDRVARGRRQSELSSFQHGSRLHGRDHSEREVQPEARPNVIRAAIEKQGIDGSKITIQPVGEEIGQAPKNEVLIRLPNIPVTEGQGDNRERRNPLKARADNSNLRKPLRQDKQSEKAKSSASVDLGQRKIRDALCTLNDLAVVQNKADLNTIGRDALSNELQFLNPLNLWPQHALR